MADGEIHYFIAGGEMAWRHARTERDGSSSTAITTWVAANFEAQTVDGVTVYDLSAGIQ